MVLKVSRGEAVLVTHVIPSSFTDRSQRLNVALFDARTSLPRAGQQLHWTSRFNLDGVAC